MVSACAEVDCVTMNTGAAQQDATKLRRSWGQIRTYADLQQQLHRDLIAQHPEWIEANGDCPTCDSYDRRLAELLSGFQAVTGKSATQPT